MLYAVLALFVAYLLYLLWEKWENDRAIRSFQHVIHVNGIRGKTGVCRLIDAHLRGAGYRVFTKTTGSTPCYIDTQGVEHEIRRWGNANIGEQLSMIRKAHREKAEILIIECMAVQPELQTTAQEQLVHGDLNVITNVRYDHVFEMGDSLEQIADSLAGTIPENGVLFTSDADFYPRFCQLAEKKNTQVILCTPSPEAPWENDAIACAVGTYLGIPADTYPAHRGLYQEDFGSQKCYRTEKGQFYNLFSANDPISSRNLLLQSGLDLDGVTFLYNNRADRPDRLLLFARYFFPQYPGARILVMGEARGLALRMLKKHGLSARAVKNWREALEIADGSLVVGLGNIKGQAYDMITCMEGGGHHE